MKKCKKKIFLLLISSLYFILLRSSGVIAFLRPRVAPALHLKQCPKKKGEKKTHAIRDHGQCAAAAARRRPATSGEPA